MRRAPSTRVLLGHGRPVQSGGRDRRRGRRARADRCAAQAHVRLSRVEVWVARDGARARRAGGAGQAVARGGAVRESVPSTVGRGGGRGGRRQEERSQVRPWQKSLPADDPATSGGPDVYRRFSARSRAILGGCSARSPPSSCPASPRSSSGSRARSSASTGPTPADPPSTSGWSRPSPGRGTDQARLRRWSWTEGSTAAEDVDLLVVPAYGGDAPLAPDVLELLRAHPRARRVGAQRVQRGVRPRPGGAAGRAALHDALDVRGRARPRFPAATSTRACCTSRTKGW